MTYALGMHRFTFIHVVLFQMFDYEYSMYIETEL